MKSNNSKVRGLFVTGTDTGVGKTHVTEQILRQLGSQSISCVAMKPVASGAIQTANGLRNEDALKLQQASSVDAPYELVNPYCFESAVAPHIAAQQTGVSIDSKVIVRAFEELVTLADVIIVEGVGGWQVPLNTEQGLELSVASLAEQLQLPVLLVVGLRVGCINHALLSDYTIYNGASSLAGWIANSIDKDLMFADEQIEYLQQQLLSPLLAKLPWQTDSVSPKINYNNFNVIDLDHCLDIS